MPGVSLDGVSVAGGIIIGGHNSTVYADSILISVVSDADTPHSPFSGPHLSATVASGSPNVFIGTLAVARIGDPATCGHTIANGSSDVIVN